MRLQGVYTALITPFNADGLDEPALRRLVQRQIEGGISGIVPLGSTGEAATVSFEERARIVGIVMEEAGGKVPVIVGAATNNTTTTIDMVRQAKELDADAAMVVVPYYNKPTPDGIVAHVEAVAEAVDIPLVAYNVPSRTGTNMTAETAARLADLPALIGLKEASGNVAQVAEILRLTEGKWDVLSGEDALLLPILSLGGQGLISTTSNIVPDRFMAVYNAWTAGDPAAARREQLALLTLIGAMFRQSNPIPVKAAASLMGLCENRLRLPLVPMAGEALAGLRQDLAAHNLLG